MSPPANATSLGRQRAFGLAIFLFQSVDQSGHGGNVLDLPHALPGAPDVAPSLLVGVAARAEIHFRLVRLRQIVGIEPRRHDRSTQIVAMDAREEICIDDVAAARRFGKRAFIGLRRIGFLRRDEAGADIGEIGAERLRGQNGAAARDRSR